MIIYETTYEEVETEVAELSIHHSKEIDLYQEHFTVDPDLELYRAMNETGVLRVFACRENKELVGYAFFMVHRNPHYKGVVYGVADILYIKPSYRKTGLFSELMSYIEESMKEEGVSVLSFNFKNDHDHPELAESLGFNRAEVMYSKYIGRSN